MISFILDSLLLGVGLAMDAFSVSVANSINEPKMRLKKLISIAGTFAFFQFIMPLIGWSVIKAAEGLLENIEKFIPWAALVLLVAIGSKMIIESLRGKEEESIRLTPAGLIVQGIATSIDALSVGFTIASYGIVKAIGASAIIGAVTLVICLIGLKLGRKLGMKLASKAGLLGGAILILIGIKIFIG